MKRVREAARRPALVRAPALRTMARWCVRGFALGLGLALLAMALAALQDSGDGPRPSPEQFRPL